MTGAWLASAPLWPSLWMLTLSPFLLSHFLWSADSTAYSAYASPFAMLLLSAAILFLWLYHYICFPTFHGLLILLLILLRKEGLGSCSRLGSGRRPVGGGH